MQRLDVTEQKRHAAKYAAIYIRVSSDKQEDNYSLETQKEACLQYAREHGYIVEEQHIYQDIKTGALYRERPHLTALRAAARKREFDVVIIHDLDRLSRNAEHQTIIIEDLAYNGVKLECVLREIDSTPEGKLMLNILGYTASLERERLRERTMRGRRARAEYDKKLSGQGRERYGLKYNEDRSKYLPDDTTVKVGANDFNWTKSEVVKRIFSMAYDGVSIRQIAIYLTHEGIPTPFEGKSKSAKKTKKGVWCPSTVQHILKDPYYCGKAETFRYIWLPMSDAPYHKHTCKRPEEDRIQLPEGTIIPLIDEEVYNAVQERLAQNKRFASRNAEKDKLTDTFLRCGFIVCGYCECAMVVKRDTKARNGRKPDTRYRCNRARGGIFSECKGTSIVADRVHSIVWGHITEVICNPSLVEEALKIRSQQQDGKLDELTPIEKSIASVERKIKNYKRVLDTSEDDDIIDDAVGQLDKLAKEKRRLENEKNLVLSMQRDEVKEQESLEKFKEWCAVFREKIDDSTYIPSYEEKVEACNKLGIKITVWRADHKPRYKIEGYFGDIVSSRSESSPPSSDRCPSPQRVY
jgi:site-specific DNA recombinase